MRLMGESTFGQRASVKHLSGPAPLRSPQDGSADTGSFSSKKGERRSATVQRVVIMMVLSAYPDLLLSPGGKAILLVNPACVVDQSRHVFTGHTAHPDPL